MTPPEGAEKSILKGMKILLTCSSRHGATESVAEAIAERLREEDLTVDVAKPEDVTDVSGYDAFILGSAVYMTHWTPEAVDFTKRFHDELETHPVWAFSVGLSGLPKGAVSDPHRIGPVLLAIEPEGHKTFAGRFDPAQLTLRERTIARLGGASEGDYRDFEAARQWGAVIAASLRSGKRS